MNLIIFIIFNTILFQKIISIANIKTLEVCQKEILRANCEDADEIIDVIEVKFGRMRIGRCITKEEIIALGSTTNIINCSTDVTTELIKLCGFEKECFLKVIDMNISAQPCLNGLFQYLEVDYRCIKIAKKESNCVIEVVDNQRYLVDYDSKNLYCGQSNHPWNLKIFEGQQINILVMQYQLKYLKNAQSNNQEINENSQCSNINKEIIGHVYEINEKTKKILCVSKDLRESLIYSSHSNNIELHLYKEFKYIFSVQGIGCKNLKPPNDAWIKRNNDISTMGCYTSRHAWILICKKQRWTGVMGNCTQQEITNTKESSSKPISYSDTSSTSVFMETLIISVLILTCLLIFCTISVFIQRKLLTKRSIKFHTTYTKNLTWTNDTNNTDNNIQTNSNKNKLTAVYDNQPIIRDQSIFENSTNKLEHVSNEDLIKNGEDSQYFELEANTIKNQE